MNAKSAFDRYLSSQTFWATKSEHSTNGLQFVGCSGISVNAIIRLIYTKHIMQHSDENCAQSYKAFMKSKIFSTEGDSRSNAMRALSNASGFSKMYFSSEKKNTSLPGAIILLEA